MARDHILRIEFWNWTTCQSDGCEDHPVDSEWHSGTSVISQYHSTISIVTYGGLEWYTNREAHAQALEICWGDVIIGIVELGGLCQVL